MHRSSLLRRAIGVGVVLLGATALAAAPAAASDADLGCGYSLAPDHAGPVGHTNPLRLVVRDCSYEWDQIRVAFAPGAYSTRTTATGGFDCQGVIGRDLHCVREEATTGGTSMTIVPQCPAGANATLTLTTGPRVGAPHTGDPKTFPCTRPPIDVLRPPMTQSLATAVRRGVVVRFKCAMACVARADLSVWPSPSAGYEVGKATIRRSRAGTYSGRVMPSRATRRRWRRRAPSRVRANVTLTARTGESVTLWHDVRLRR